MPPRRRPPAGASRRGCDGGKDVGRLTLAPLAPWHRLRQTPSLGRLLRRPRPRSCPRCLPRPCMARVLHRRAAARPHLCLRLPSRSRLRRRASSPGWTWAATRCTQSIASSVSGAGWRAARVPSPLSRTRCSGHQGSASAGGTISTRCAQQQACPRAVTPRRGSASLRTGARMKSAKGKAGASVLGLFAVQTLLLFVCCYSGAVADATVRMLRPRVPIPLDTSAVPHGA